MLTPTELRRTYRDPRRRMYRDPGRCSGTNSRAEDMPVGNGANHHNPAAPAYPSLVCHIKRSEEEFAGCDDTGGLTRADA